MSPTLQRLLKIDIDLVELERLRKAVDPASGATISISRGVDSDPELAPDWPEIRVETGELTQVHAVIEALRTALLVSRSLNLTCLKRDVTEGQKYLDSIEPPAPK